MVPPNVRGGGSDGVDGGILGRGWTPPSGVRATILVGLGLLLIVNPLVGGLPDAIGLDGDVEYAAAEIEPSGGGFELSWVGDRDRSVAGLLEGRGGLTLVDCYPDFVPGRACALESGLIDGPVGVDEEPPEWGGYTYHGRLYERTTAAGPGNVTLALRPVPARAVLANVSAPLENAPEPVRRAVEEGSVRVDPPVRSTGLVLKRDGSYHVVLPVGSEPREEPPDTIYTAASTALGVLLVGRGMRAGLE
jgi:hypothetical protein